MNYVTLIALAAVAPYAGAAALETPPEQASYGIGYSLGEQLKGQNGIETIVIDGGSQDESRRVAGGAFLLMLTPQFWASSRLPAASALTSPSE